MKCHLLQVISNWLKHFLVLSQLGDSQVLTDIHSISGIFWRKRIVWEEWESLKSLPVGTRWIHSFSSLSKRLLSTAAMCMHCWSQMSTGKTQLEPGPSFSSSFLLRFSQPGCYCGNGWAREKAGEALAVAWPLLETQPVPCLVSGQGVERTSRQAGKHCTTLSQPALARACS